MRHRWSRLVLGVVLVAAPACGDDGDDPAVLAPVTTAPTTTTTAAPTTTTPPTLDDEVARVLCAAAPITTDDGWGVFALPPLFGDYHISDGNRFDESRFRPFHRLGDTSAACDGARVIGRLPPDHPALAGQASFLDDWLLVVLADGTEGWVNLHVGCIYEQEDDEVLFDAVCRTEIPEGDPEAERLGVELGVVPVVATIGPLAADGSPDLTVLEGLRVDPVCEEAGQTFDPGYVVSLRNAGTAGGPASVDVRFGDETVTFTFLRGLEPGEEVLLGEAAQGSRVVIDPADAVAEPDEGNNDLTVSDGPELICQVVDSPFG